MATATKPIDILVVEDSPVNADLYRNFLQHAAWRVDFASDGEMAIDKCLAREYDIILMDLHMPGLSGIEAAREIRKLSNGQHCRILTITADASPEHEASSLAAGCNLHLTKPVLKDRLRELIIANQ